MPIDRLTPILRPDGRPAGFQRWRNLLFLHWELPIESIQRLIPPGLTVDTFEGRAYVGLVPFTMRDVSPWWSPSVPGVSNFHELNLRTYVHQDGANPAVWFFSLDAAATLAVLLARLGWSLPYYRASMSMSVSSNGQEIQYTSNRWFAKRKPAHFSAKYLIGEPLGPSLPGSFEHFLAERYLLISQRKDHLMLGQVHHRPYPLHQAIISDLQESMLLAAGLPAPGGGPHVLYSPGVDVDVYALRPL